MYLRRAGIALVTLGLATAAFAARKPGDPLKPGLNFFSKQQDIEVGQENAKQVLTQYEVVKNQFLQDYVQRLGQKLAASPDAAKSGFKFTFTVLNVDEVNAFALPGGPMFIYTGLLKTVDNEAQLAGVMGHEMAHVILRHGTHEATKASGIQLLAGGLGALLGGGSSMGGKLAQAGLGLTANSFILKFSRDAETEADAMGSHMMAESGYDPVQMSKFFQKLAAGGQQPPQILSDHPNPGNRETAILAEMSTLPARKYGYESGEFARAKKELALVPKPVKKPQPAAPASSSTEPAPATAPAASASGWQEYRGTGFALSYPPGWQAAGSGADVTITPRDGVVTKNGATQIGFGALVSLVTPEAGRNSLQSATDDLIRQIRSENPSATVAGAAQSVRVGGANGLLTMLRGDSPFGGVETDAVVTVVRPHGLFYLIWISPEKDYNRVESSFRQMLNSLKFQ
jgi:beta-barrel assembly-enhancing protease